MPASTVSCPAERLLLQAVRRRASHARTIAAMQLATKTTYSIDELLDDWRWLVPEDVELVVITKAGDAFIRRLGDGAILRLNVVDGSVEQVCASLDEFQAAITDEQHVQRWFMPEIVQGQALLGMDPGENECLSFKHPPILGGQIDPDNIEVSDVAVHFSIAGQIHKQVKDLPPGATINELRFVGPGGKKPWWRFW